MKATRKIRLKVRQFNPNAPKSFRTIQKLIENRKIREQQQKEMEYMPDVFDILVPKEDSENFSSMSEESSELISDDIEFPDFPDSLEIEEPENNTEDSVSLVEINAEAPVEPKKLTQKQNRDRLIVKEFYDNPTDSNFKKLWNRFYIGVRKYAFKLMGDQERAEDIVQDTFQRAWEKRDMYDPKKSTYITWLYIICRNFCLDRLANDSKTSAIDVDINDLNDNIIYSEFFERKHIETTSHFIVDTKTNLIKRNSEDEVIAKMYDASMIEISKMDPIFQRIISMKELDNMSLADIADELSVSESKVKNVYYKSKGLLAEKIKRKNKELFGEFQQAMINRTDNNLDTIFKTNHCEPDIYEFEYEA